MRILFVAALIVLSVIASTNANKKVLMCYYGSWAVYRKDIGKVDVLDLDPFKCTHIIYTFVGITGDGKVESLDKWRDYDLKGFENMRKLREKNPALKLLVAIGGWNQASINFSKVAANPSLLRTFAENAKKFVLDIKFDGFDMDWEYPADRGGVPSDKSTFVDMLRELKTAFKPHNLLLTAAVGAGKQRRMDSYDVVQMNKHLDYLNLMSYDIHGVWDQKVGHNAPLSRSPIDDPFLNIEAMVDDWISAGMSSDKLVLGLAFYGRSFVLANPNNYKPGAPITSAGTAGRFTQESGSLSYLEICEDKSWNTIWDDIQKVPYARKGNELVGYDNPKSLELKVDLASKKQLAGVMMWSIEQDDVHNTCKQGKYPLLTAVYNRLFGSSAPSPSPQPQPTKTPVGPPAPTSAPAPVPVPGPPSTTPSCKGRENDYSFFSLGDLTTFYRCVGSTLYEQKCGGGTSFDTKLQTCIHSG